MSSNCAELSKGYELRNVWNIYLWPMKVLFLCYWSACEKSWERLAGWHVFRLKFYTRDLPNIKRDCTHMTETLGPASHKFLSVSLVVIKHLQIKEHREITSELIYYFCWPFCTPKCLLRIRGVWSTHTHTSTRIHVHIHRRINIHTHTRTGTRTLTHRDAHTHSWWSEKKTCEHFHEILAG